MSYPGYNPYQQGSAPGAPSPYPQQPHGGAPPYPHVNPNSFGYPSHVPMQMPQPMPMPTYPPSAPDFHSSPGGYPPSGGGYPASAYPPNTYPPSSTPQYPPSPGGYGSHHSASGAPPSGHGYQGPHGPYGGVSYTQHSAPLGHAPSKPKVPPTLKSQAATVVNESSRLLRTCQDYSVATVNYYWKSGMRQFDDMKNRTKRL